MVPRLPPCVTFWGIARAVSTVAASFTSPPAVGEGSRLPTSFSALVINCLGHRVHPSGYEGTVTVLLVCISVTTNDAVRIFVCVFAIRVSSPEKRPGTSLARFLFGLCIFLLASCKSSLYLFPGYKSLIRYIICARLLLSHGLSFLLIPSVL